MPKKTSTIIVTTPKERKLPKHFRFLVGTRVAIRWRYGVSDAVYIGVIEEVTDRSAIARAYATVRVDEYRWNGIAHFQLKTGFGISGDEAYKFEVATPQDEEEAQAQILKMKKDYWEGRSQGRRVREPERTKSIQTIANYDLWSLPTSELEAIALILQRQIEKDERNRY